MRAHLLLLAILLAVVGVFSALAVTAHNRALPFFLSLDPQSESQRLIENFRSQHSPLTEINLTHLYSGNGQFLILSPLLDLRKIDVEPNPRSCSQTPPQSAGQLPDALLASPSCKPTETSKDAPAEASSFRTLIDQKDRNLESFLAGYKPLAEDFLTSWPLIDRNGISYAFHLASRGPAPYNQKEWVSTHLADFKPTELPEILRRFAIDHPAFAAVSRLNENEISQLVHGADLVLTRDFLLVRNQSQLGFSPLSYWVYESSEFKKTLAASALDLVPRSPDLNCVLTVRDSDVCWTLGSNHALSALHRDSVAILSIAGVSLAIFVIFYIRFVYSKHRAEQRRRLALQVLSHEFRTPVSSMLILSEQLNKSARDFDSRNQDLLTRLTSETYRLQRIIEVSKSYLQIDSGHLRFQKVEIGSINSWAEEFLEDEYPEVKFTKLTNDSDFQADPFWLKFVLSNLLQNALDHGHPPVRLQIEVAGANLRLSVTDQGHCDYSKLRQMTQPFVKNSRSAGMGLGLNLVSSIITAWGGEFRFSVSPTTFSFTLGHGKKSFARQIWLARVLSS